MPDNVLSNRCGHAGADRRDGRFRNPWPIESSHRFGGFLRWVLFDRLTQKLPEDPAPSVFKLAKPAFPSPRAAVDGLTVTWVGHATVLLQLGSLNMLTDPHWSKARLAAAVRGDHPLAKIFPSGCLSSHRTRHEHAGWHRRAHARGG